MNGLANYDFADLTQEQLDILKKAEEQINKNSENPILIMALKSG